jgi:S-DNA-T family DNA segregation ATPase FtsK/SpoIIIE
VVLGVPDAYELPSPPGNGYLKSGIEPLVRFKAAYVSGPEPRSGGGAESVMDVVIDALEVSGPLAHQLWHPPLDRSATLGDILGMPVVVLGRGLQYPVEQLPGGLRVPIALVDKPREHLVDTMWLDLAGASGNVAIVGRPLSGKSTAIRTLIWGLVLTHTPAEVQVYCLDFGGGSLSLLKDLPHVGGVAMRIDPIMVRRTIGEIQTLLAEREQRFTALGVDSMASYRRRQADDPFGDVFLVVDGWGTLRSEFEELEPVVTDIATRGLPYGIHLVVATGRWMDFRLALRATFGSRVELRLGDPGDSDVNRRAAANVPEQPGSGLTDDRNDRNSGLHLLTLRPGPSLDTADLVKLVATNWTGAVAPRVRMLPSTLPYAEMDLDRGSGLHLPIGISEQDLSQVEIDFATDPHFLLFGDVECGKSSFLRALATTVMRRFAPEQARIVVVDYRRSLLDLPESEHRIGYGKSGQDTTELIQQVANSMRDRLPDPDVTAQQLRERSWWTGPELFVLVDDYDLVAGGWPNPLVPLLEFLPQARDIGLHLVITRRVGGAGRALFDPIIQRLVELSSPSLIMSGPPEEGVLIGSVKPTPQPPGRGRLITRREGVRLIQLFQPPPR